MNTRLTHDSKRPALALPILPPPLRCCFPLCRSMRKIRNYSRNLAKSKRLPQPIRKPSLITPGRSSRLQVLRATLKSNKFSR